MRISKKRNLGLLLITAIVLTLISTILFYHQTTDRQLWTMKQTIFANMGIHQMLSASETPQTDSENEEDRIARLEEELPHLPISFLTMKQDSDRMYKKNCAILPTVFDIKVNNIYWQHLVTKSNRNFYLYSAYYDDRKLTEGHPTIRILGMVDQIPPPTTFCQFWYDDDNKPRFSRNASTHHHIWINAWGNGNNGTLHPVLITCVLPLNTQRVPAVVSLVEDVCDNAKNAVRIFTEPQPYNVDENAAKKPTIAVCVKGLNYLYEDRSVRLVEWFELLRILGAEKVFMYAMSVHPNILKVLQYYHRDGLVDLRNLTLPGDQLNQDDLRIMYLSRKLIHKRQNEVMPYNDCLYRSLRRYDYVVLLDSDEVIMPTQVDSWQRMLRNIVYDTTKKDGPVMPSPYSSLCAVNTHFYDNYLDSDPNEVFAEVPKYLHMLNQVHRMINFSAPGMGTKCFHVVNRVMTLHNHYPMSCGSIGCKAKNIRTAEGRMHHYRNRDRTGKPGQHYQIYLNRTVVDKTVWKFKEKLVEQSNLVLNKLGLLKP